MQNQKNDEDKAMYDSDNSSKSNSSSEDSDHSPGKK